MLKSIIASLILGFAMTLVVAHSGVMGQTTSPSPSPTTVVPSGAPSTGMGGI